MEVCITFNEVIDPNKYAPLSPINIFAFGKLNNKKQNIIKICPDKNKLKLENSLSRFVSRRTEFIIIKWIANKPLNPSVRLHPLIIKRKQRIKKQYWKRLFSSQLFKNINPVFVTSILNRYIPMIRKITIRNSLIIGFRLTFMSSKKPNIKKKIEKKMYSELLNLKIELKLVKKSIKQTIDANPPILGIDFSWNACGLLKSWSKNKFNFLFSANLDINKKIKKLINPIIVI